MKRRAESETEMNQSEPRFVLIFDELAKVEQQDAVNDVSLDEMDAIEKISRMVLDVTEEHPIFMTST